MMTKTVIIAVDGAHHDDVKLGGCQQTVRPYVAQLLRCESCQDYEHKADWC